MRAVAWHLTSLSSVQVPGSECFFRNSFIFSDEPRMLRIKCSAWESLGMALTMAVRRPMWSLGSSGRLCFLIWSAIASYQNFPSCLVWAPNRNPNVLMASLRSSLGGFSVATLVASFTIHDKCHVYGSQHFLNPAQKKAPYFPGLPIVKKT